MFLEHETLSAWQLCSTGRTNTHTHPPQEKSAEQHHKTANVTRPSTPSIHITAKNSKKCKIRQNTEKRPTTLLARADIVRSLAKVLH